MDTGTTERDAMTPEERIYIRDALAVLNAAVRREEDRAIMAKEAGGDQIARTELRKLTRAADAHIAALDSLKDWLPPVGQVVGDPAWLEAKRKRERAQAVPLFSFPTRSAGKRRRTPKTEYVLNGRAAHVEKAGPGEWSGWFEDDHGQEFVGSTKREVLDDMTAHAGPGPK